ncbi:Hypothetical predicted protein [Cloeon dipterum]|uniref:Uncharacterized protein n=1 Tax=Cloeon dipterum TaxID=197152 RepID=A0A8S1DKV9_9INSE|nr:Hypothetical predicted protein [Cloeon dipterum]
MFTSSAESLFPEQHNALSLCFPGYGVRVLCMHAEWWWSGREEGDAGARVRGGSGGGSGPRSQSKRTRYKLSQSSCSARLIRHDRSQLPIHTLARNLRAFSTPRARSRYIHFLFARRGML